MLATQKSRNMPLSIIIASVFIVFCALALVAFALTFLASSLTAINNSLYGSIYATQTQARGFILIALLILLGAGSLMYGVRKLLVAKKPSSLILILAIPLCFGTVGQTIDFIGDTSAQSNLIGVGILLLFAIPIVLLKLPASTKWYSK